MIKIKYYGKITDPKDLVTAEYVNENGGKIDSIEVDGVEQPIVDKTVSITGFAAINEKIPAQASSSNQLADKNFVNNSIENVAAYYITKDAAGNPFATKVELTSATTFYSGGQVRVPTRNDYCVVLADESKTISETGENPTTRYLYDNNTWSYQYIVNRSGLTAAQWATLNSGIIAADKTNWDAKYTKPSGGIPDSDIASASTWNAKANQPSFILSSLTTTGWSGKVYNFNASYPFASYDIEVSISPLATDAERDAYASAMLTGASDSNNITALGEVPTIAIPVFLKVWAK